MRLNSTEHIRNSAYITAEQTRLNIPQVQLYDVSRSEVTQIIKATINWKIPVLDNNQNICFKKFGAYLRR